MKASANKSVILASISLLFNTLIYTSSSQLSVFGQGTAKAGTKATTKHRKFSADEINAATEESNKLYRLAEQKEKAGKLDEAKQLYYKAAVPRVHVWGVGDPAVAKISLQIGQIESKQKHFDVARAWFKKSLGALSKHYGPGDYELMPALLQLAKLESSANNHETASAYYEHVLSLQERKFTEDNVICVPTRISLIHEWVAAKDFYEAEKVANKAIAIEKKVRGTGTDDYRTLEPLLVQIKAARASNGGK